VSTTNQTLNDVDCYDYWEVGVGSIKQWEAWRRHSENALAT
jgi:hypothetical protein